MIAIASIGRVVGIFLIVLSVFMLAPAVLMIVLRESHWAEFLLAAGITALCGLALAARPGPVLSRLSTREAFLLTTTSWTAVGLFGALPLVLVEHIDFVDALFEAMSGITTTGATVLTNLETHARGILLWRSLLQWLGGIGFVVMGIAILPFLRVGGMRLFRSESSDWSDKVTPRFGPFARSVLLIYIGLSALCALAYYLQGMSVFDAVNHAMTTISTGGFSTHDASMGYFRRADVSSGVLGLSIHWTAIGFMLLGALPFSLYVLALRGQFRPLFLDRQVRGLLRFLILVTIALSIALQVGHDRPLLVWVTDVGFNVVSVVTTTGYASEDYTLWGPVAHVAFFYLMFVGGCSGSTSGAIKMFRFQVASISLRRQLKRLVHPNAVIAERYNDRDVSEDIIRSLIGFSFFYALTIAILAMFLALLGIDLITSLTGAVTAVGNVGPGLGNVIGPAQTFADLPDSAKLALSIGMLLGRLEIMTVLVLFTRPYWLN
ncbi:MAG: TrkH family potassium uptake protein [Gammaproteobacteria bacterium]|nr:TrkH family potassium uptake protein [Gammaproteobacteria bacterium]